MSDTPRLMRLQGFHQVARAGGFASAARAGPSKITQPALHQQVRKLELELGVRLLRRAAGGGMEPTAEGRTLLEFVGPFLDGLPAVVRSLRKGSFGGTITIHAAGMLIRRLLPRWMAQLRHDRPDIVVELHEAETPPLDLLRSSDTDLVIDYLPEVPPDVDAVTVATAFGFVVAPRGWPEASTRGRLQIRSLREETFVGYLRNLTAATLQDDFLRRHRIVPQRRIGLGSAEAILGFVEAGLGWSVIPWLDRKGPRSPHLAVAPVDKKHAGFPLRAAYRTRDARNPLLLAALKAGGVVPSPT